MKKYLIAFSLLASSILGFAANTAVVVKPDGSVLPADFFDNNKSAIETAIELSSFKFESPLFNSNFVFEGDSNTANPISYATYLEDIGVFVGKGDFHNVAFPGANFSDIDSEYSSQVYPFRPSLTGKPAYLFVRIGTNDPTLWGDDYADGLLEYCQTAEDDGFTVIIGTIPQRGDNLTYEIPRSLVNTKIRQSHFMKIDIDALFPNAFNTTYYNIDRIHFNDYANETIANNVNWLFSSFSNTTSQIPIGDRAPGNSEVVHNTGNENIGGFKTFLSQIFANTAIQIGTGAQTFVSYASSGLYRNFINNNGTTWIIDHMGSNDDNALSIMGKDALNGIRIDWNNGNLLSTGTITGDNISSAVKELSSSGVISLNWEDRVLKDASGENSVYWSDRQLVDNLTLYSLDWQERKLILSSGVPSLNWEDMSLVDNANQISVFWQSRELLDDLSNPVLNWNNKTFISDWEFEYPINISSSSSDGAGTFTLSSGSATVSSVYIQTGSVVLVTVKTVSGTRLGNPDIVPNVGSGNFTATGAATDNSTYNYVIINVVP